MHVWINGVLYLFTVMMETCQQLKSQWLHQILTRGSQKCWKKKLEKIEDMKKRKESRYDRIIQIINGKIIVFLWSSFHESETCEKKSNLIESQKISVSISFFPNMKNGKVTKKWTPTFLYNFGKNITLMSSDILLQYISKFSAMYKTVLALWAEPRTLKFSDEWWHAFFFIFSLYFYKLGNVNGWKGVFMIYDLTLEQQFALLEKQ